MWEVQLETEIALSQALAAWLLTCTSALTFQSSSHLFSTTLIGVSITDGMKEKCHGLLPGNGRRFN